MPHQNITLAMKKYIIILLLTSISLNAQKIVTKYNKYMYGGKPHVWWGHRSEADKERTRGEDSQREDAKPWKWEVWGTHRPGVVPLPYFSDFNFKDNWYLRHWSLMSPDYNERPPSHATKELGPPTNINYGKVIDRVGIISHFAEYVWIGKTTDEREFIVLNGEVREISAVVVDVLKTRGDFSKNNKETAKRSLWIINNASLLLREPDHCTLNMCLPEFKCPGHGLSARQKISIIKASTVEEQEILRMGYSKQLASKFTKGKELREKLLKESEWYLDKAATLRREVTIVRK